MEFTLRQAEELVECFGGDNETTITVVESKGHGGKGLYAYCTDYPEEGSTLLGDVSV